MHSTRSLPLLQRLLRPARVLGLGLVVALWLGTQWVALLHGVMHRPAAAAALGAQHVLAGQPGDAPAGHAALSGTAHADAEDAFGHAPDGGLCQLFDQLAHADALWSAPAWAGPPAAPLPRRLGVALPARCIPAAGAHARGPPRAA
jgi:hypothetical protein